MNNRTKGISLAIITAVMWGIMGMFVRGLTGYAFTTFEISFFLCALAGGAYFLFLLFTKPSALKINLKGLVICLLYGAVAYSISFVSYSVAVSRIPVGGGNCADVYESDLGGNPGTVYVWRKTAKKQDGDDFDLSDRRSICSKSHRRWRYQAGWNRNFSWSDQWCRSSTSDSAPEIFCKRPMRGIHCWCMDFSGQLLY